MSHLSGTSTPLFFERPRPLPLSTPFRGVHPAFSSKNTSMDAQRPQLPQRHSGVFVCRRRTYITWRKETYMYYQQIPFHPYAKRVPVRIEWKLVRRPWFLRLGSANNQQCYSEFFQTTVTTTVTDDIFIPNAEVSHRGQYIIPLSHPL